jgi:hypothetical protein
VYGGIFISIIINLLLYPYPRAYISVYARTNTRLITGLCLLKIELDYWDEKSFILTKIKMKPDETCPYYNKNTP